MPEKLSPRMRTYYILIVAVIVLFSFGAIAGLLYLLEGLGVIPSLGIYTLISLLLVSGITVALMSYFIGRRVLTPLVKLSSASKEVARGNFDVTVSDSSKMEEVQSTFRNFNAMVRELKSISTLSSDFIANVSHEFKTPLSVIEGYAMLLQDDRLTAQEREDYLNKILVNTRRLNTLVGNILMLSKMETKPLPEQYTRFRLDEQLRQVVAQLEPQWSAKGISFRVRLDEVELLGWEQVLPYVWSNLISNAIKFSPSGSVIALTLLEQRECAVVTVSDRGCGMEPDVQERIFEKFYQGDTSHKAEGNGLGLALVRQIVELSQGVVEVESQPGKGSTFRVILPKS
ncbi:MAG: HAMP domain-containing sensor histidine kinase [Candidatus Faecousia sp.]|jgi:signal transduction histidine kinase|uniref:HAMP domain-containing sensor histidine kinase n=1 Tax=Faecousia sp. TaxID=2952921 RepID=UPI002A850BAD|nr:HAMP domain-containing sensor histidine kinase [Candidatus Faecousia sp.]